MKIQFALLLSITISAAYAQNSKFVFNVEPSLRLGYSKWVSKITHVQVTDPNDPILSGSMKESSLNYGMGLAANAIYGRFKFGLSTFFQEMRDPFFFSQEDARFTNLQFSFGLITIDRGGFQMTPIMKLGHIFSSMDLKNSVAFNLGTQLSFDIGNRTKLYCLPNYNFIKFDRTYTADKINSWYFDIGVSYQLNNLK